MYFKIVGDGFPLGAEVEETLSLVIIGDDGDDALEIRITKTREGQLLPGLYTIEIQPHILLDLEVAEPEHSNSVIIKATDNTAREG